MEITIRTRLFEYIKKGGLRGGAENAAHYYTIEEIDKLENYFTYIEIPFTEAQINDAFWYNIKAINEYLGISEKEWEEREKQW